MTEIEVIKNINHYLNFLEEFQAIPKEFQTREQIESSEVANRSRQSYVRRSMESLMTKKDSI
jgi:hypothetical protein